jgi:hypothetical protein
MNATLRVGAVLTALALAACTTLRPVHPPGTGGVAESGTLSAAELLAAVQRDADGIDQSTDSAQRSALLAAATASARQCLAQFPGAAACPYAQAQVQGLSARATPLAAPSLLKDMLVNLAKAEAQDPGLDHAGPARLSAIVLLRAPPWPLGPGDVDAAVTAAQRAVKREPTYPPNLIALGQAQAKAVGTASARATFASAQQAVQAWSGASSQQPAEVAADRAKWQQQVEQGLHDLQ